MSVWWSAKYENEKHVMARIRISVTGVFFHHDRSLILSESRRFPRAQSPHPLICELV